MSPRSSSTLLAIPCCANRFRACSTMPSAISMPATLPSGPTASASASRTCPVPKPGSRTASPGCGWSSAAMDCSTKVRSLASESQP